MSFHFLNNTKKVGGLLEEIKPLLDQEKDNIFLSYQRLSARLPYVQDMSPGERYDVKLDVPLLTHSINGTIISHGPVQLLGTYNREHDQKTKEEEEFPVQLNRERGHLVWGWNNPSIPSEGYTEIRAALMTIPEFENLMRCVSFDIDADTLELLAGWCAIKAGWSGVYRAPVGDVEAYMCVKLYLGAPDQQATEFHSTWCTCCGRASFEVERLVAAEHGFVCSSCIKGNLLDCFQEMDMGEVATNSYLDNDFNQRVPMCFLCGTRDNFPRLCLPYSAMCKPCFEIAQDAVREKTQGDCNEQEK